MKKLKVTIDWLNWFHKEAIEVITTIDNKELFSKSLEGEVSGNHLSYNTVFKLVDSFLSAFDFLIIDYIRLIWCEKLKNDNLQLSNRGDTFEDWKESVLKGNYEFENSFGGDYEDPTNIYYNYLLDAEGKDMSLYKYNQTDGTLIFLWYNPKTDTTMYSIDIELRKALFSIDKYFDVHLPDDFIEHNKIMLAQAEDKIMSMFKTI